MSNTKSIIENCVVAPFAGAWIEISKLSCDQIKQSVAPFAGAWIEIHLVCIAIFTHNVAPFAGAWIEI